MIQNKEKIKYFLKENKWIIAAMAFFIVWKLFLIFILWDGRLAPPEPDDSYTYINQIASVKDCPHIFCNYPGINFTNDGGFIYLSYRIFFGIIAKLFFLSPTQTYHLGFYLGTVLISITLLFFLRKITNEKKVIAFLLFFLAFYYGTGETHGFYWVVPSFYSMLLFFLILTILLSPKKHFLWLFFITPIFIFIHPLSIYFSLILPIFYIFLLIFEKKNNFLLLKKIALLFIIALICHLSVAYYLGKQGGENYFSVQTQIKKLRLKIFYKQPKTASLEQEINHNLDNAKEGSQNKKSEILSDYFKSFFPTWEASYGLGQESFPNKKIKLLSSTYFTWFFPTWIGFFPFIFFLIMLLHYRQHIVLSLYFSSLIFFVISIFSSEFGHRSAIILWIASFLFYGLGFFYSFHFVKDKVRKKYWRLAIQIVLSFGLFIFIFLNAAYSIIFANNLNTKHNFDIRPEFLDYVTAHTQKGDRINMASALLPYTMKSNIVGRNPLTADVNLVKYLILLEIKNDEEKMNNSKINILFHKIMRVLKIQKQEKIYKENEIPKDYYEEARIGSVIIYKNSLWNQQ